MTTEDALKNQREYLNVKDSCDEVDNARLIKFITEIERQYTKKYDNTTDTIQSLMVRKMDRGHLNAHLKLPADNQFSFTMSHFEKKDLEITHIHMESYNNQLKLVINEVTE